MSNLSNPLCSHRDKKEATEEILIKMEPQQQTEKKKSLCFYQKLKHLSLWALFRIFLLCLIIFAGNHPKQFSLPTPIFTFLKSINSDRFLAQSRQRSIQPNWDNALIIAKMPAHKTRHLSLCRFKRLHLLQRRYHPDSPISWMLSDTREQNGIPPP